MEQYALHPAMAHVPYLRQGVIPLDRQTLRTLSPQLANAWDRIEAFLDTYTQSAHQITQYVSNLITPYPGPSGVKQYAHAARAAIPYLVNLLVVSGPPGSGKSTLLASIAAEARHNLYQALQGSPARSPLHIILDMIDVTLIPSTDTILTWLLKTLHNLIDEIYETYLYSRPSMHGSQALQAWQKLVEDARELLGEASRVNLDPVSLIRIAGDLDEYSVFAADALQSGYSLPLRYVMLAWRFREELGKLLWRGAQPGVIAYILDDLDALEPPRLLETILSCKLLSLDPYTLCIVSIKDKTLLASRVTEYIERMLKARSVHRIMHTIDIAYVVEKLVFNAPVVRLPAPNVQQAARHVPSNMVVLSQQAAQSYPSLEELAKHVHFERLRGTRADRKITLATLLFDNFPSRLTDYENFYGKNLQILRCLDRLYTLLYELVYGVRGSPQNYYLGPGDELKRLLEILSTCTIESEYAAALGFDAKVITEGVYTQRVCTEPLYTELFSILDPLTAKIVPVNLNADALLPRLVTLGSKQYSKGRCRGEGAYGGRTGWFQERYVALAGLMRDVAWLAGLPALTMYDEEYHIYAIGDLRLPLVKLDSIEYLAKLAALLGKLAHVIRDRIARGTFAPVADPTAKRGKAQLLYFILNYIAMNIVVAAYAALYACLAGDPVKLNKSAKRLEELLEALLEADIKEYEKYIDVMLNQIVGKLGVGRSDIDSKYGDPKWLYKELYEELVGRIASVVSALEGASKECENSGCGKLAKGIYELTSMVSYEKMVREKLHDTHALSKSALLDFIDSMARIVAGLSEEREGGIWRGIDPQLRAVLLVVLAAVRGGPVIV